jgi:hypothetical protein
VLVATTGARTGVAQTPAAPGQPGSVPAKTSWQPFPSTALGETPTAPPLVVPSPAVAPPSIPTVSVPSISPPPATVPSAAAPQVPAGQPIGTRVVVYQKPAGGDRALTAQEPPKPGEDLLKPAVPKAVAPPIPDPKPIEIRLLDDAQLDAEILRAHNAKQLEMYNRSTVPEKVKPKPTAPDQLPPSEGVRRMLAASEPAGAAARSTVGAPPSTVVLEPGYIVHRRLYFEEKNSERYGWSLGIAQPFISAGYFYKDLLLYPMKLASNPRERYDSNAGKAMAGSPVPYLLYPPELTFGGMVIGSTAIVGTVFLLP